MNWLTQHWSSEISILFFDELILMQVTCQPVFLKNRSDFKAKEGISSTVRNKIFFPSSFQIIPISLHSLFHLHWVWITCSFSDTHCSFPLSCFLLSSFSLEWPCLICLTFASLFIYLSRNNSNATSSYFQLLETFPFSLMFS